MTDKPRRKKFPPHVYAALWVKQNGRCACGCNEKMHDGKVQYDHIVSLAMGGKDEPENLQALIVKHHADKTSKEATIRAKCDRQRAKHFGPRLNKLEREIQKIRERRI